MKTLKKYTTILLSACILISCEKPEETTETQTPPFTSSLLKGVFVINEGAFGQSNGDISFFSSDSAYQNTTLFNTVNNRPLGDVIQSMSIVGTRAYLVANNSQKIEVVSMTDFKSVGVITGLSSPRFVLSIGNNEALVSDWFANNVKIINTNSLAITGTIATGHGPEQMVLTNQKVYVANVGGFDSDSTLTVINANNKLVMATLPVGVNPNSLKVDANGKLWVLCGGSLGPDFVGGTPDDVAGKLIKIDPTTNTVLTTFEFAQAEHPVKLAISTDKTKLYYLNGNNTYTGVVCVMDINSLILPTTPLINREFYGLGINPANETIYGGVGSFSSNSWMLHFTNNGVLIDSAQVGIGPNSFVFN